MQVDVYIAEAVCINEMQATASVWVNRDPLKTEDPYVVKWRNTTPAQASKRDDDCTGWRDQPSTHRRPVDGVPSMRVLTLLHVLMLIYLIN